MGQQVSGIFFKKRSRTVQLVEEPNATPPVSDASLPEGFKWQSGRGFKVDGNAAYPLPNDEKEVLRLNLQHYLVRYLFDDYYLAPVKEELERGIKVLDAGCGTGIWSLEMAKLYPASHFTGTDIVNVFEETIPKAPVNCNYEVANTLKGLPFQDGSFDYVFQRFQTGCFRKTEWPLVIAELIRVTKPGGWLELVDTQGTFFNAGPRTSDFHSRMVSMLSLRDIDLTWPANFKRVLEESGMEEIGGKMVSVPVGWGPKDVAKVSMANTEASYKSLKPSISVVMGLSDVDYDELIAGSLKEFVPYETYWNIDCVFSKKPVDGAAT